MAVAFVALNIPFWWMQRDYFLVRPWLNIDLLLPLVLFPRRPRLAIVLLIICWILDLVVSNSATFHFNSPYEFLRSTQFLTETHLPSFVSLSRVLLVLPFVIAALLAGLSMRQASNKSLPWVIGLSYALLISGLDVVNGSSILSKRTIQVFPGNPARSPAFSLLIRAWQSRANTSLFALPAGTSATEHAEVYAWAGQHPHGSILLVVVESMGWHTDEEVRRWLFDRVATPSVLSKFRAVQREIRFTESTTSAELRELCSLRGSYRNMTAGTGAHCLPAQLAAAGWETRGFHGFSSQMFDRNRWWTDIGLKQSFFADSMFTEGARRCGGGFPGLCDADVINFALTHDIRPATFNYILTLNSHLPLTPVPIPADLALTCQRARATEEVCTTIATIGLALDALSRSLAARQANLPLVVVVGDHSPPFSDLSSRREYDDFVVPAIVLTPTSTS